MSELVSELISYQDMLMNYSKDESPASKYRRWVRENGTLFVNVDQEQSKMIAKDNYSQLKKCYSNCYHIRTCGKYSSLRYFEGNVMSHGIPIDHAFLVDENNVVIDPTFGISNEIRIKSAKKYGIELKFDNDEQMFGSEYFGIEIPKSYLYKIALNKKLTHLSALFLYWEMIHK